MSDFQIGPHILELDAVDTSNNDFKLNYDFVIENRSSSKAEGNYPIHLISLIGSFYLIEIWRKKKLRECEF